MMKLRLALREEGSFWNAYIARADTMEGAKLIGSILMGPVRRNPDVKADFMALMKTVLADGIKEFTGEEPTKWDERAAPESERSGHG
jgi:hypothetical protein